MKTFNNVETTISFNENEKFMNYSDLLNIGVLATPAEGWSVEDMKQSITISSKLEKLEKDVEVSLEDAEFKFAYSRIPKKWTMRHDDIIRFVEVMDKLNNE